MTVLDPQLFGKLRNKCLVVNFSQTGHDDLPHQLEELLAAAAHATLRTINHLALHPHAPITAGTMQCEV